MVSYLGPGYREKVDRKLFQNGTLHVAKGKGKGYDRSTTMRIIEDELHELLECEDYLQVT
jgi:hypothetical protein